MIRTESSVRTLQAIALIATFAVLMWSLGLPSIRFADAASLTNVSDTISDSSPSASSTHTFVFTSPTGIVAGEFATITMPVDFTGIAQLAAADVTVATGTDSNNVVATCGGATDHIAFSTSGQDLLFEFCSAAGNYLEAGGTTTITIGAGVTTKITNPSSPAGGNESYEINIAAGASDTGSTRIVILDSVTVTASVDTIFTFAVGGLPIGSSMNGDTSTGSSTPTSIPFGELDDTSATRTAQLLTVNTNAANGYSVSVAIDGPLESSTGADIDSYPEASADDPETWSAPAGTLGQENTYGHWGVTSDDSTTIRSVEFGSQEYIGVTTTPRVVMSHDGPVAGQGVGVGTTTVGYQIEISALQEAGDDYTAQLFYIATPTF